MGTLITTDLFELCKKKNRQLRLFELDGERCNAIRGGVEWATLSSGRREHVHLPMDYMDCDEWEKDIVTRLHDYLGGLPDGFYFCRMTDKYALRVAYPFSERLPFMAGTWHRRDGVMAPPLSKMDVWGMRTGINFYR